MKKLSHCSAQKSLLFSSRNVKSIAHISIRTAIVAGIFAAATVISFVFAELASTGSVTHGQQTSAPTQDKPDPMPTLSGDAAIRTQKADTQDPDETTTRALVQELKLTATDGATEDRFGNSVAISGDTAIVGVPYDNDGPSPYDIGSAYIFVRSGTTWVFQQKLTVQNPRQDHYLFGIKVAISGDTAVVCSTENNGPGISDGAVYVFVRSGTTWTQQQKLTVTSTDNFGDLFAGSVAIAENTLIVGHSYTSSITYLLKGSAYVFTRSGVNWTQRQKLRPSDSDDDDSFGDSLGISGDTVIVGMERDKDSGGNNLGGAAYIFERSGSNFTQRQKLTSTDPPSDFFGHGVAISNGTAVATTTGANGLYGGKAYVYVRSGANWTPQQTLTPSNANLANGFGRSVSISGEMLIVGAIGALVGSNQGQGAAYIFNRCGTTWFEGARLIASDGAEYDSFGEIVALSGETAIVGVPYDTIGSNVSQGSAYIFNQVAPCIDVTLSIDVPDTRFEVGDVFPAVVKVNSTRPESRIISFADPLLRERPFSGLPADAVLTVDPYPLPPPFELTAANSTRSFTVPVRVNKLGVTELVSSLSYTGPGGIQGTVTKAKKISAPPFAVTVNITPRQTVLDQTPAAQKTARCRQIEAGNNTIKNCIEITTTVRNSSDRTISNVNIPNADNPLTLINETNPKLPGEPLVEIEHNFPPTPVTLAPGVQITWTWRMNAYDAPAALEFEPTVFGVMTGQEVGGHGNKKFQILENVLLKWGMRPTDGRTDYISGQNVRADGFIENVSAANGGIPKLLRVHVYQIPSKNVGQISRTNAGGGFVVPFIYSGPNPTEAKIFDVPATGAGKRIDVRSVFRSFKRDFLTRGGIEFGVNLRIVEDDGRLTPASERALLDEENGYTDNFEVRFSPEETPTDEYVQDCLNAGFLPILCSFNQAFAGEFADGLIGLTEFGLFSLEKTGEGTVRTTSHALWALKELGKTAMLDPAARDALVQEAYVQYLTFYNLGVISGQVAGQAPMAFNAFSVQWGESMGRYFQAIEQGDLGSLQEQTGHFLGANPDLLLEPLMVSKSFMTLSKSLKRAGNGLADNLYTATARQKGIAQAASLDARIATAEANGTALAKALAAGDTLKPNIMRKVFGTSQEVVERMHTFARKNEIIMAFRARHPRAQTLLDSALAWAKPQALKFKTVNEVDIRFLGYRRQAEATLEIIEPPAGIIGKVDEELQTALDQYMDVLVPRNPDLVQNPTLRKEVRDRLETRAEEWNKYVPQMKLNNLAEEVKIGVNFGASEQFVHDVAEDVGVKSYRRIERAQDGVILDQVTGTNRRVFTLKMEGPNGLPARPVVGDIDFLGILDKYGRMIRDNDKRWALYKQLQQFMEHGESFTYRYQDQRRKFLECCVEGGEAMMTVGPWDGPPRAGFFVNNLSVMDEFNASFKRVRGTTPVVGPAGQVILDSRGRPIEVTSRFEDVTGEYSMVTGTPVLNNPSAAFVARFAPLIFDVVYAEFRARLKYYFPSLIGRLLDGDNRPDSAPTAPAIFRRNGPVLQVALPGPDLSESNALRIWTIANGWQPITRTDALAAGEPGVPDMAPNSSLPDGAAIGSRNLTITPPADLDFTGDFFAAGDAVVINPGGVNQEVIRILSINPIVLTNPLTFEHKAGEMIAFMVSPTAAGVSVSGRVLASPEGRGVRNARVVLTDQNGQRRSVITSARGYYRFDDVEAGQNVILSVMSRRFQFEPRVIDVSDNLTDIDFFPNP